MIRSLWAAVQDDPTVMRRINGWATVAWFVAAFPICLWLSDSVPFLVFISVYAVVTGHLSTWQACRVEVRQEEESDPVPQNPSAVVQLAQQADTTAKNAGAVAAQAWVKADTVTDPLRAVSLATGFGTTGILAIGADASYTVALSRTMPDAGYVVDFIRSSGLAVGKATLVVTARSATTVTVKVTAVVLLAASDFNVIAHY